MNNLNSCVYFADENTKKSDSESYKLSLPAQKRFSKCSCIFPPHVFLYDQSCVGKGIEIAEGLSEDADHIHIGKLPLFQVKEGIDFYTIKYDNTYEKLPIYLTQVPFIHKMKSFLKRAIACADEKDYKYLKDVKKKKKKRHEEQKNRRKETPIESPGNILLSGFLAELDKEASKKHNADNMSTSKGSDGGSSLLYSDDDTEYAESMTKVDNEEAGNFMGEDWEWNNWAPHGASQEIPGPKIEDKYNGPHKLEDGAEKNLLLHYNV
eukprot:11185726-Ditylum_brightwellii.AAC.1